MIRSHFELRELREVATIDRRSVSPEAVASGDLFVGLENILSDGTFVDVRPVSAGELKSNKFRFGPQHVLYGKLRPYLSKIARPRFTGICSTDILPILPGERVDGGYLTHFLRTPEMVRIATARATGINLPRLGTVELERLQIPLPPIEEQRRIAAVLDATDALRAKRRQALAKLDTLTQAIFIDMFGDPVVNTRSWRKVRLGDVATKIGSGATPRGGEAGYSAHGIALIRSMNVHDRRFVSAGLARLAPEQAARLDGVTVEVEDVLLNITGASVARVCLAPADVLPARVNQHVAIVRTDRDVLGSVFLAELLATDPMKAELLRVAGSGATREAITKRDIEELRIISPPTALQKSFERASSGARTIRESAASSVAEFDALFSSLQQRAFRGDL